jgi:hypothetical protein
MLWPPQKHEAKTEKTDNIQDKREYIIKEVIKYKCYWQSASNKNNTDNTKYLFKYLMKICNVHSIFNSLDNNGIRKPLRLNFKF